MNFDSKGCVRCEKLTILSRFLALALIEMCVFGSASNLAFSSASTSTARGGGLFGSPVKARLMLEKTPSSAGAAGAGGVVTEVAEAAEPAACSKGIASAASLTTVAVASAILVSRYSTISCVSARESRCRKADLQDWFTSSRSPGFRRLSSIVS